jgi:peptidoglycan hydrolase-like protein with peptidoglycan-binding domain
MGLILLLAVSVLIAATYPSQAITAVQKTKRVLPRKPSTRATRVTPQMIREVQQDLINLGYWIKAADGKWGEASRHGLIAFQKVEQRPRTGKPSLRELQALKNATRPRPRERGAAHVEVDLARQVLFMVDADGTVSKILPVSSGNGKQFEIEGETDIAVTPAGRFRVYRKLPGWRKSPLGLLYYPNYLVGGIAIHGNPSVPAVPASHGCIRIPMFAAEEFSSLTPIGTPVYVYADGVAAAKNVSSNH